jgi:hypothetical protein
VLDKSALILIAIFGSAFALRVWGISFGLPYDFTPDEIHEIVRALKLGAGEYSWVPGKGGLYYFLFAEYALLFVFWWLTGQISGPYEFAFAYLNDPTAFYLLGRLTVAMMGAVTCLVIFQIGTRVYSRRTGAIAALIGATAYYHAFWSHYINVDIGLTLSLWSSILAYLLFEQQGRIRWLAISAVLGAVAFAFKLPGIIIIVPIFLAIVTARSQTNNLARIIREGSIFLAIMFLSSLIIVPENVLSFEDIPQHFSKLIGTGGGSKAVDTSLSQDIAFDDAVKQVTVFRGGSYLKILFNQTNLAITLCALLGITIGLWRRNRWSLIFAVYAILFLIMMSMADRPGEERYMLPIVPALWLLGANAITMITRDRGSVSVALVVAVISFPLFALVERNYTWTRPDTRIIAKNWIEQNVRSNSRILMDGMRYRFIQSPPLTPNQAAVDRRVLRAEQADSVSRGISSKTLEMWSLAMSNSPGPKYDLFSTVYGLKVNDLSYYVEECFDYIVTSSQNASRYQSSAAEEKYPMSAKFYRELNVDPRFENVFSSAPERWKIQGPVINVYKVSSDCE